MTCAHLDANLEPSSVPIVDRRHLGMEAAGLVSLPLQSKCMMNAGMHKTSTVRYPLLFFLLPDPYYLIFLSEDRQLDLCLLITFRMVAIVMTPFRKLECNSQVTLVCLVL